MIFYEQTPKTAYGRRSQTTPAASASWRRFQTTVGRRLQTACTAPSATATQRRRILQTSSQRLQTTAPSWKQLCFNYRYSIYNAYYNSSRILYEIHRQNVNSVECLEWRVEYCKLRICSTLNSPLSIKGNGSEKYICC